MATRNPVSKVDHIQTFSRLRRSEIPTQLQNNQEGKTRAKPASLPIRSSLQKKKWTASQQIKRTKESIVRSSLLVRLPKRNRHPLEKCYPKPNYCQQLSEKYARSTKTQISWYFSFRTPLLWFFLSPYFTLNLAKERLQGRIFHEKSQTTVTKRHQMDHPLRHSHVEKRSVLSQNFSVKTHLSRPAGPNPITISRPQIKWFHQADRAPKVWKYHPA